MKIYRKLVLDIDGKVEFEDSYDYSGPIDRCKGGGPSGTVVYPTGITNAIQDYLGQDSSGVLVDTVDSSVIDLFNAGLTTVSATDVMQDGGFDDDGSWTKESGWTVGSSVATATGPISLKSLYRNDLSLIAGATYEVTFTVAALGIGEGGVKVRLQGGSYGTIRNTNATFIENIIAGSGTSGEIRFEATVIGSTDFNIDTVTVKLVTGNPYVGQSAFDPDLAHSETVDSPLSDMQTRHDILDTFVAALDEEVDWDTMVTKVIDHSTSLSTLFASYDIDSRVTTLSAIDLTESDDIAGAAITEAITNTTTALETNAHVKAKTLVANLDTLSKAAAALDSDSIIGTINTTIMSKMSDMIATAVTAAKTAEGSASVSDMVDEFEKRRTPAHFRAVNRFAGPLADIGAINSSAYIFGMAAIEAEFSREVSEFDANATMQVFTLAIGQYGDAFKSTFSEYSELYKSEIARYLEVYLASLDEYMKAVVSFSRDEMGVFRSLAVSHIAAEIQSEFAIRNQRVSYFINSVKDMATMLSNRSSSESNATALQTEISRMKMVALKEQIDRDIEIDSFDALWDIKLYQYVGNMIGAPGGGSGFIPDLPSTGASALGGALAGAGVGASFGPIGAGIGAVVGGVAGLLE